MSNSSSAVRMASAERFAASVGHRNFADVTGLLSARVIYHVPGRHVLAGSFHGVDEVLGHLADLAERSDGTFDAFKFEDWLVSDLSVAALMNVHIQAHGATVTERIILLLGFDDSDKIAEITIFFQDEDSIRRFYGP